MNKTLYILLALLGMVAVAKAQSTIDMRKQDIVDGVSVENVRMERNGRYIVIDMLLDLSDLDVDDNRAVLLTPWLANGNDSLGLQSVGVYGRRRYYFYVRNGESMLSGKDEKSYKVSKKPDTIEYHIMVPYTEWMNSSVLSLHRRNYGCCNTLLTEQNGMLGRHTEAFSPNWYMYVRKDRSKNGIRLKVPHLSTFLWTNGDLSGLSTQHCRTWENTIIDRLRTER